MARPASTREPGESSGSSRIAGWQGYCLSLWRSTGHTGSGRPRSAGLYVAHLSEKRFRRVEEVPAVRCWAVTEGPDGEILVGATEGVFRLAGGRWRQITTADGLRHDVVLAVAASRPNEFWVGYWYSGSVTRVRVEGERLSMTHYGSELGLRGEMTYFLGFDARGQLWAGTDQGVRVFNGDHWDQYDHNDGLIWDDCDLEGFAAEPDGTVWIGTSGGLARFTPSPLVAPSALTRCRIHPIDLREDRRREGQLHFDELCFQFPDGALLGAHFRPRKLRAFPLSASTAL